MKRFSSLFTAIIIFIVFAAVVQTTYIIPFVLSSSVKPLATYGVTNADCLTLQEKAFGDSSLLPVYGSSELGFFSSSFAHPSKVFRQPQFPFTTYLVGAGGTRCMIQSLHLAALGNVVKGKKLVIILSPQWFSRDGMDESTIERWFSRQKIYRILDNPGISKDVKAGLAARLLKFPAVTADPVLALNLYATVHENRCLYAVGTYMRYPQEWLLNQVDLIYAFRALKNVKQPSSVSTFSQVGDWEKLRRLAENEQIKGSTNNEYGFNDAFWTKEVKKRYLERKNYDKHKTYAVSPEYDDLRILVEVLKELKAKPLFVIVPVKGKWSDYTGFTQEGRLAYYRQAKSIIANGGFPVADYSDREYDNNFLTDNLHLSGKGWATIDEAIYRFYTEHDN